MELESSAKTVRGLNIAILVISIVSAIVLGIIACSGSAVTAYINKYIDNNGSIAASAIEQVDANSAGELGKVIDSISNMSTQDVHNLGAALAQVDANALNEISQSLRQGNPEPFENLIETGAAAANVDIDEHAIHDALESMSKEDMANVADSLSEIDASELSELALMLQNVSADDMEQLGTLLQNAGDGEIEQAAITAVWAMILVMVVIEIVVCIIAIISAVMAMRNCREPQKLTGAFVMAIVSAILAFITGRLISMVLFIISAVYISKVRKLDGGQQSPVTGYAAPPVMPQ